MLRKIKGREEILPHTLLAEKLNVVGELSAAGPLRARKTLLSIVAQNS